MVIIYHFYWLILILLFRLSLSLCSYSDYYPSSSSTSFIWCSSFVSLLLFIFLIACWLLSLLYDLFCLVCPCLFNLRCSFIVFVALSSFSLLRFLFFVALLSSLAAAPSFLIALLSACFPPSSSFFCFHWSSYYLRWVTLSYCSMLIYGSSKYLCPIGLFK